MRSNRLIITVVTIASVLIFFVISYENKRSGITSEQEQYQGSKQTLSAEIGVQETGTSTFPVVFEETIDMLFFGDLMIDRYVGEKIDKYGMDYLFARLATSGPGSLELEKYDIVMANLEGTVTNDGAHYAPQNAYDFAFSPDRVAVLKEHGFNFFNLANNHFSDQGERGIIETRKNLDELGIPYVGCKDRQVADFSTKVIEVAGKKIGMAGFSQVYGLLDADKVLNTVRELASSSDYVVVNIHWGIEYQSKHGQIQQDLAHKLVDAGADAIIGHHPHVVQGSEVYKGKPIFYSLGNFIFDQYFSVETQRGLAVGLSFSKNGIEAWTFLLGLEGSQPYIMESSIVETPGSGV